MTKKKINKKVIDALESFCYLEEIVDLGCLGVEGTYELETAEKLLQSLKGLKSSEAKEVKNMLSSYIDSIQYALEENKGMLAERDREIEENKKDPNHPEPLKPTEWYQDNYTQEVELEEEIGKAKEYFKELTGEEIE